MFYRRKLVLALFQLMDCELDKKRIQQLLYLTSTKQVQPAYEFVQVGNAMYSFSLNADLTAMIKHGQLIETAECHLKANSGQDYLPQLKKEDRCLIDALIKGPGTVRKLGSANSISSPTIFSKSGNDEPHRKPTLYTIGYEGISLEAYLNRLLKHDIKVLADVRNNPQSMKFGFSQKQLALCCETIGIQYVHFPEVGITSTLRQSVHHQDDYNDLFESYKQSTLTSTGKSQAEIIDLLRKYQSIAITCFEANICQCHRKHLAEALQNRGDLDFDVCHI